MTELKISQRPFNGASETMYNRVSINSRFKIMDTIIGEGFQAFYRPMHREMVIQIGAASSTASHTVMTRRAMKIQRRDRSF